MYVGIAVDDVVVDVVVVVIVVYFMVVFYTFVKYNILIMPQTEQLTKQKYIKLYKKFYVFLVFKK